MKTDLAELLKLESQRLLLILRIKELETGTRPSLEDIFPTEASKLLSIRVEDDALSDIVDET